MFRLFRSRLDNYLQNLNFKTEYRQNRRIRSRTVLSFVLKINSARATLVRLHPSLISIDIKYSGSHTHEAQNVWVERTPERGMGNGESMGN